MCNLSESILILNIEIVLFLTIHHVQLLLNDRFRVYVICVQIHTILVHAKCKVRRWALVRGVVTCDSLLHQRIRFCRSQLR